MTHTPPRTRSSTRIWSVQSLAILTLAWAILQVGCLFTPGLLDDVDSIYIEIAREMLCRHDFVTPYINGIRFFDKPPLMYWMAAASMRIFGPHDWAGRLPLALAVLALIVSVYALGLRLFRDISPAAAPDRGAFYAALAIATSIGPYLFTRFYIPDVLLALWMTLAVHCTLVAIDRLTSRPTGVILSEGGAFAAAVEGPAVSSPQQVSPGTPSMPQLHRDMDGKVEPRPAPAPSPLLPCLAFAAVTALNVLTKGLIGLIFPLGFVFLYLALTRQLKLIPRLHLISSTAVFFAIAAPWHILAALRTPAIALPSGLGLPATGGWAWFYLYNEHIARFLGHRIPHDYGQVPVSIFWLLLAVWLMPWTTFLPGALAQSVQTFRQNRAPGAAFIPQLYRGMSGNAQSLPLLLWALLILIFFTLSTRQEYYSLPALPALALMAGGLLARADAQHAFARRSALNWHLYLLLPLATLIALVCGYFAIFAPRPSPGTDISALLAQNPQAYTLSLGHLFDLTVAAMGLFRGPLAAVAISMLGIGPLSYLLRRCRRDYAANLALAASMIVTLLAAHEGLVRFYPILGSKSLALAIDRVQQAHPRPPNRPPDLILFDGELASGSSVVFYTRQQVHLLDGRVNALWYGSFWPDSPAIFESESTLRQLWSSPRRIFLFTTHPAFRRQELAPFNPVHTLATSGGKTVLTNHD